MITNQDTDNKEKDPNRSPEPAEKGQNQPKIKEKKLSQKNSQTKKSGLESLHLNILLKVSRFLTFKEIIMLSNTSKRLRKSIALSLKPTLRRHFSLKSYIEKYPFSALRATFNKRLVILSHEDLDYLLAISEIIKPKKPKNVSKNPGRAIQESAEIIQKSLGGKNPEKSGKSKKSKNKKRKKSSFNADSNPSPVNISKRRQHKLKPKKILNILPGKCITQIDCTRAFYTFLDYDRTLHIMPAELMGRWKKYKPHNMIITLRDVRTFQITWTCLFELEDSSLGFVEMDKVEDPATWRVRRILGGLRPGSDFWSSTFKKLVLTRKVDYQRTRVAYVNNFPSAKISDFLMVQILGGDLEEVLEGVKEGDYGEEVGIQIIEIKFGVRSVTAGKNVFYLVSEEGEVYEGQYEDLGVKKISKVTYESPKVASGQGLAQNTVKPMTVFQPNKPRRQDPEAFFNTNQAPQNILEGLNDPETQKTQKTQKVPKIGEKALKVYSNNYTSFICHSDTSLPKICELTSHQLSQFFRKIGLGKYAHLITLHNINGQKLLEYSELDLEDNLGMEGTDEQNHLMLNVNNRRFDRYLNPEVNVWGYNGGLELGISTGTKVIPKPHKLDIRLQDPEDTVKNIKIGNGPSVISTQKGQFFVAWKIRLQLDEEGNVIESAFDDGKGDAEDGVDELWNENDINVVGKKGGGKGKKKGGRKKASKKEKTRIGRSGKVYAKKHQKNQWRPLHNIIRAEYPGFEIEDMTTSKDSVSLRIHKKFRFSPIFVNFLQFLAIFLNFF